VLQPIKHFWDHLWPTFSLICQENGFHKTMPNSENQYSCQKQLNSNEQYPIQNEHTSVNIQEEEYTVTSLIHARISCKTILR